MIQCNYRLHFGCLCLLCDVHCIQGEKGEGKGGKSAAVKGDFGIEWQIQFVKAEQLIQKHLNHPKLRCLLFALLINKVFVGENVIASEHIRRVHEERGFCARLFNQI